MSRLDEFAIEFSGVLLREALDVARATGSKVNHQEIRNVVSVAYSFAETAEAQAMQRELNRNTLASIGAAKLAENRKEEEGAAQEAEAPAEKKKAKA